MTVVARLDCWEDARGTRLLNQHSAGATSLTVTAGGLSTWGPVAAGRFPVVLSRGSAEEEHVYGAAVVGDQITGVTQIDGTPGLANTHVASASVEHGLFAEHVDQPNEFLSSPTAAGQVAVSDAADSWGPPTTTLEDMTLVTPVIADLTGVQHDHSDAADGGSALDLSAGSLVVPRAGAPAQTADGSLVWDLTNKRVTVGDGASRKTMVDTDSAQTLALKTLTAPVIADLTNVQHDHGDADDGGAIVAAALPAAVPLGTLGYAEVVSGSPEAFTAMQDITGMAVTVTAGTGRRVRVKVVCEVESNAGAAGDVQTLHIREGGTALHSAPFRPGALNVPVEATVEAVITPTAGSHTYKLSAESTGTGAFFSTGPAFIIAEDIGAA